MLTWKMKQQSREMSPSLELKTKSLNINKKTFGLEEVTKLQFGVFS